MSRADDYWEQQREVIDSMNEPGQVDREKLKTDALELVNQAYRAFGKEPLLAFTPAITDEDTDCVIQAIEEATGLSLDWGGFDGEKHWLSAWGSLEETTRGCNVLADTWGTVTRFNDGLHEVEVPASLAEFAGRIALEGEYPELVKE